MAHNVLAFRITLGIIAFSGLFEYRFYIMGSISLSFCFLVRSSCKASLR